jgi:hypothetical protein
MPLIPRLLSLRRGIERRLTTGPAKAFWLAHPLLGRDAAHDLIWEAITEEKPYCVARFGTVEQKIVLWGMNLPKVGPWGLRLPAWYDDTYDGASNAGIRPRNRSSYRAFAKLAFAASQKVDLLPTWFSPAEYAVLRQLDHMPTVCGCEDLSPGMEPSRHWASALTGKRVLVVSPFKSSIENQITRLGEVWAGRGWNLDAKFTVIQFPYLIDDGCLLTWSGVWDRLRPIVLKGDYDVGLFGCGGLGLSLAAAAKDAGKVGLHLGGHLQLLFGIYGARHLEQPWNAGCINPAWIRPGAREVPVTAGRVENGCYW